MTPRQRLLCALRGGQPDRVPMPLRMWKFLRKHYADEPDPLQRGLRAHEEFGIDLWHYCCEPWLPCFTPLGKPWRDDVEVEMGDADPAEMKRKYGDRVSLMGGIDAVNEVYLSAPDAIRRMVKDRMAIYKPGARYIMDGSNSIVYETPAENVRALAEAGLEHGWY